MAYSISRSAGALLLALGACGHVTDEETTESVPEENPTSPSVGDPPPGEGVQFRFFTSYADGEGETAFGDMNDVFVNAVGSLGVTPGDYYFYVTYQVCPPGQNPDEYFPYQSVIPCRTFTVGANGTIVAGTPAEVDGTSCGHASGVDSETGGITVGLMPFERNTHECGGHRAFIIPSGEVDHQYSAVAILNFYAPPPPPIDVCGNGIVEAGETCDDGNEADHDGCSGLCQLEEDCEPVH